MDPTRYWMLTRTKLGEQKAPHFATTPNLIVGSGGSSSSASYYESWEERAFAEDSAGHLGGCVWPPRSYSCSFCGREFRSAQALGGHMNVHRRDRARLKLAGVADDSGSDNQIVLPRQSYTIQPCPPQVASLQHAAYVANPTAASGDTNLDPLCSVLAHPPRSSLAQASSARNVWGNQPLTTLPGWIDTGKKVIFRDAAQLTLNHRGPAATMSSNHELNVGSGDDYNKLSILGCRKRMDYFRGGSNDDEDSVHVGCKRRRVDLETPPLILCSFSRNYQQDGEDNNGEGKPNDPKVLKLCSGSPVEELDLELRLGEAPKMK